MIWLLIPPLAIVVYVLIGVLCASHCANKIMKMFPSLPFENGDRWQCAILGGLIWPFGYPAFLIAYQVTKMEKKK